MNGVPTWLIDSERKDSSIKVDGPLLASSLHGLYDKWPERRQNSKVGKALIELAMALDEESGFNQPDQT